VPGFFLAGVIDPIDTTSLLGTGMAHVLPTTHFVTICRALFIKGATLPEIWSSILSLLGISAVWLTLGALAFRKRVN
jgi:ABC-type multidrug transport system permease subunit